MNIKGRSQPAAQTLIGSRCSCLYLFSLCCFFIIHPDFVPITRTAQVSSADRCPTRSHFTAFHLAVSPMITDPLFNPDWTVLQGVEPPADPCTQFIL